MPVPLLGETRKGHVSLMTKERWEQINGKIKLEKLDGEFCVSKVASEKDIDFGAGFCFVGKTDEELSLVCPTASAPKNALKREDGWRAFRVKGVLDFSLVGILAKISGVLAENGIGIFALSTYNTDYILVRKEKFDSALKALSDAGYEPV